MGIEESRRKRRRMIAMLEAGVAATARPFDDVAKAKEELRRWAARVSWGIAHMDKLDAAQAAADAAWERLEAEDPDGDSVPPEQDEVDRLLEDVDALVEGGRWPRHLHWSV